MFTLLGFVLYGLLFEARARYVYIFSPFFIILAVLGFCELRKRVIESQSIKMLKGTAR